MNSPGSCMSRCHSTSWRSQAMRWSSSAAPAPPFLVLPVRGDAFFGDAMHFLGADLHFEVAPARAHHRGVQRLIQVRPRNRDEILDAARNRMPLVVDHAQRRVAVLHRVGDDAHGQQIVHLVERDLLPLQLLEDRVGALHAAVDARRNSFARQMHLHGVLDLVEERFVGGARGFELLAAVRPTPPAPDTGTPDPPVRRGSLPMPRRCAMGA